MTTNFYGPMYKSDIIRKTTTNIHELIDQSTTTDPIYQRHTTTPNPEDASPEDDYGFTTIIEEDFSEYGADALYVETGYVRKENDETYIETNGE